MYKKIILSAAAAITMTSSAYAFDADSSGTIYSKVGDKYYLSGYENGDVADENLRVSTSQYGDALIYPRFVAKDGWESEITVVNPSDKAIVAKVVLYAASDSRELRDFNIYLSKKDIFTFKINKDGLLTTDDGSYAWETSIPKDAKGRRFTHDQAKFVDHKKEVKNIGTKGKEKLSDGENEGYIIIYGMAQSSTNTTGISGDNGFIETSVGYHNDHLSLFKDYRLLLDNCRGTTWRDAYESDSGAIKGGMLLSATGIKAPNIDLDNNTNCGFIDRAGASFTDVNQTDYNTTFESVSPVLYGNIRLMNATDDKRDLVLPATALENYTPDNQDLAMLWTEGEYAAIQDRAIDTSGNYDKNRVENDAKAFVIKSVDYVYREDSFANKVIFTQPMKRILNQLAGSPTDTGNIDGAYYSNINKLKVLAYKDEDANTTKSIYITNTYGCFNAGNSIFGSNEEVSGSPVIAPDNTIKYNTYMSPYNTTKTETVVPVPDCFRQEVEVLNDSALQINDNATDVDGNPIYEKGGQVNISVGGATGIPAIVTQMSGSVVDGDWQTNWVYAPTK